MQGLPASDLSPHECESREAGLKVGAFRSVMCPLVRKKMLISGVPAWLSVSAKNMERASRYRGC